MGKGTKDYAPAVSGNEGKLTKVRDIPPRLPAIQKRVHGLPAPIKVKVSDGMGMPTPGPNQPTGGTRKRHRAR
jgi:hypothetical protein